MQVGENISMNLTLTTDEFVYQVKKSNELLKELRTSLVQTAESTKKVESNINGLSTGFRHFMQMAATARFAMLDFHDVFLKLPMSIIKTSGEMERMLKLMEGLSTASDKLADAKRSQAFVFGMAQSAPYDVKTLTDSFVKLKSGGIDPTNGSMQALVDSVAKFGGSSEQLHRASIAIQQMGGKGVISMEELRQQLGEAVPNAINMMAIGVGKSMADLTKAISNGEVESKSALERMFAVMAVQNHGAANAMMDTWVGMIEQLKTKWELFKYAVGGGPNGQGVFAEARKEVESLLNSFDGEVARKFGADLSEGLYEFATVIRGVIQSVVTYYEEIKTFGEALLVLFAANKVAGFVTAVKGNLVALGAAYKANAAAFVEAEAVKTADSIKFAETQAIQAMMSKTLMQEEIAAKQAQVAALKIQHAEATASYVAHNAIVRSGMIGNWVIEAETRAASAALATQALMTAEAIAIESRAIQSESAVLAQNIIETNALIAGKAKLAAEMLAVGGAAGATGAKMAGMGGIFTALGGWMTVFTATIMAAVWAWEKFGSAAEKNAERARRATNKMSTVEDLSDSINQVAKQRDIIANAKKGRAMGLQGGMTDEDLAGEEAKLKDMLQKRSMIMDNLRNNAADDAVKSQARVDEMELKKTTELSDKKVAALNTAYETEKTKILNDKKLSMKDREDQIKKLDQGLAKDVKQYGAEIANAEIARYQGQIDAVNKKLLTAGGEEKTKLEAVLKSLEERRKGSVEKLAKNELIGTDYEHMKGKSAGSGSNGPAIGSYTKYLEDAERDLKNAGSKQAQILGEISKTQEIENEVRAKFEALLDEKKLTKITKNAKGKNVATPMDDANAADHQKIEYLIRVATQAQKAKFALGDLKKEESALKIEQGEFNQLLDAGGASSDYASQKVEKLSAEYSNMQKELLLDCDNLKAVNEALDVHAKRLMIAAETNNFAYGKKSKKELDNAELDGIIDSQEKIRRQYELTTFAIGEEYAKRVSDTAKAADIEIERGVLTETEKQERILGVVKSYQMQQQAALLSFQKASKTPMDNLADQWSLTTQSMNKASVGWAQGFMDELTKLMTTGKADWRKFILGMATDLTRMNLEKSFGGMITNAFGGIGKLLGGVIGGSKSDDKGSASDTTGLGGMWGSLVSGAKKLVSAFSGTENAAKDVTAASSDSASQMIQEMLGITTKLTAEQSAAVALNALTVAALEAAQALGGSSITGAAKGSNGLGGLIGSAAGGASGWLSGLFGNSGNVGAGVDVANTASTYSSAIDMSGASEIAFADGGVMTNFGPLALKKYANGGIANKPQLALFGEAGAEAYVPLPDGRSIPVTMTGGGSVGGGSPEVVINIVVTNNASKDGGSTETTTSTGDKEGYKQMASQIKAIVLDQMIVQKRPGGVLYEG